VLVTHRNADLGHLDQVVVMENGRVAQVLEGVEAAEGGEEARSALTGEAGAVRPSSG
jgi:ABC-type transport system involved in cytochrome bd biosynthesis fused ATPase/permease subunit